MGSRSEHLSSIFSGSPLSGFRNKIINGGFDIWQRGVSQSAAGHGSADRWRFYFGTGAGTVSRQAFDLGQTDVPGNPRFFCRHDLSSLAGAGIGTAFGQRIEDVRTLAGRKATLTFYARAEYEQALGARAIQDFGTGGSPSAAVETLIDEFTVGQTWQKFTATVSLPSIAGKTLGSNDNSNVRIDISRNDAATIGGYVDVARVSFVEGDATAEADPFSPRHVQQEIELCRRYCARFTAPAGGARISTGFANMETQAIFQLYGHVFRATPVAAFSNLTVQHGSGSAIVSGVTEIVQVNDVLHLAVSTAGLTIGEACQLRFPSTGDYLELDAEL